MTIRAVGNSLPHLCLLEGEPQRAAGGKSMAKITIMGTGGFGVALAVMSLSLIHI